jgi:osmotically-inducible protein OsmY
MKLLNQMLLAIAICSALTGCVAVVAGGAAAGGAMVADRRSSGSYVDDEGIEWKTLTEINNTLGDKIHVNVTSYNRNVLLTGEAIDAATKNRAESIAKDVQNVRNVTNELEIAGVSSLAARNNDAYVTTLVKSNMIKENRFPANYVKVVTENSVVYLMGMVTRKEADAAVEIARSTEGVRKVVKVFEYVVEQ